MHESRKMTRCYGNRLSLDLGVQMQLQKPNPAVFHGDEQKFDSSSLHLRLSSWSTAHVADLALPNLLSAFIWKFLDNSSSVECRHTVVSYSVPTFWCVQLLLQIADFTVRLTYLPRKYFDSRATVPSSNFELVLGNSCEVNSSAGHGTRVYPISASGSLGDARFLDQLKLYISILSVLRNVDLFAVL